MPNADEATLAALAALNGGAAGNLSAGTPGADLANFQRTVAANDPWNMAYAPVAAARLNTSTWTPNQAIAGNMGQAALAAILKTLGNRDEADQMSKAVQVLPQLYKDPTSVDTPDGVDSAAFNALKFAAIGRQATTADLINRTLGEKGAKINPDGSLDVSGVRDLFNAEHEAANAKAQANADRQDAKMAASEDKTKFLEAMKMASAIKSDPMYKVYAGVEPYIGMLDKLQSTNDSSSSLMLTDAFNKAINPTGVTRYNTMKMIEDAQSPYNKLAGEMKNVLGGGYYTDEAKAMMVNAIRQAHGSAKEALSGPVGDMATQAQLFKIDPSTVFPRWQDFAARSSPVSGGGSAPPPPLPGETKEQYIARLAAISSAPDMGGDSTGGDF